MSDDSIENDVLWWNVITGPARLVKTVVSDLIAGRSILIGVSEKLPWGDRMRRCVELSLSEKMFDLSVDFIDCAYEDDLSLTAGQYLLERLRGSDSRVAYGYRGSDDGIIPYIRDNDILKNRILWLKNLENEKRLRRWLIFCLQYETNRDPLGGILVIESFLKLKVVPESLPEHVVFRDCDDEITFHDALLFCSLLSARLKLGGLWKQYIATLAAELFYENVGAAAAFIENTDFCEEHPADRIQGLSRNERPAKIDSLQRIVWKVQLQFVFPLIEKERIELVERYKAEIDAALQQSGTDATWYRQQITDAYDAELGLLLRLDAPAFQKEDKQRLKFLYDCRNKLAHMKCCSPKELTMLFN
ncbi:MAG: hypothetical protein LBC93_00445 [Synergistaceae bacterium]|jgi:hypothetical protein|nr:hypothetical protein [Synergistaceae bacterium]